MPCNLIAKEFDMTTGSELNEAMVATLDSGRTTDAFVALAGTGGAYAFMALAMIILTPATVMIAM